MAEKKGFDLGAMLASVSNPDTGREQIEYIDLDKIDADVKNFYSMPDLEELAAGIAMIGLQQPLRIRPNPDVPGRYRVVSGHRRRAALGLLAQEDPARWKQVACIVEASEQSEALQQLKLIFGNAHTRKLSSADQMEQAEHLSRLDANAQENAVSIDAARKAWKEFAIQSGETDSSVEAVSNLLQAGFTESNLQKAVEGLAGAAQRFPDTLKVESLADSLQETLATQSATGQFCELLERMGMDTETFNTQLQACTTATQRQGFVLQTLANAGLSDSYNAWKQNNAELVRSKEANLTLEESMAKLAETVLPLVNDATEQIAAFIQWIAELPDGAKTAIAGLLLMAGAISPVASVVSGAAGLVESLSKVSLPGLGGALDKIAGAHLPSLSGAFSSVFGFIAANPVVLLIGAIVGLVALVATKSEDCIEWLNMIDDFLQNVFAVDWTEIFGPVLGGALNDFFALCKEVWDGAKLMLEGIIDFIAGVFSGDWERAWEGVKKIFTGIFDSLEGLLKAPINGVIRMVNKAIDGVNWLIDGVNHIPGVNIGTIGQIPMLANGGEVLRGNAIVGEGGPELLTVLQDRTVVQPLTNNYHNTTRNLGGVTMNVYGAPGQDIRELAEALAEEMQYLYESEEAAIG